MVFEIILHMDQYIGQIIQNYGTLTYLILFLIIFSETGLVIAPFLPGDSLLFIVGTFAAKNYLNAFFLFIILTTAAIIGDTVNYWIGHFMGEKVFTKSKLVKKEYLDKTKVFYEKHGGKTIIFARFIPIMRTFAPFVAGVGKMHYLKFIVFNISGAVIWVTIFLFSGYFFGEIPFIQENLSIVILAIIFLSLTPAIIEFLYKRIKK